MIRGAALTLGTVVLLGGVGVARADDASLFGYPALTPVPLSEIGGFPHLPENWSDLPFLLKASETVGYNSNITNTTTTPGVNATVYGHPIGTLESISNYNISFKRGFDAGPSLFADGTWGLTRYLNYGQFNDQHYSFDAGVNFNLGSRCVGKLEGLHSLSPAAPGQQVGYNVINSNLRTEFNENLDCIINGEYSAQFNTGYDESTNSALADQINNYQSVFVAAGITYTVSETNSLKFLATVTGTEYTDQTALLALAASTGALTPQYLAQLAQEPSRNLTEDQVDLTYTKNFGPNIALSTMLGLVGTRNAYLSVGFPRTILPVYAFAANWTVTPKFSLNLMASRTVAAPTSIVSNLQVTEGVTAGFSYLATPKLKFTGTVGTSLNSGTGGDQVVNSILQRLSGNQKTYQVGMGLAYAMSPFFTASLNYSYNRSVQASLTTPTSTFLLALDYSPY